MASLGFPFIFVTYVALRYPQIMQEGSVRDREKWTAWMFEHFQPGSLTTQVICTIRSATLKS